jgi:hypothetical protein
MTEEELGRLRSQIRQDRKLIERAVRALAEIDRNQALADEHADVLTALRIRLEGKERSSLEDLMSATGDLSGGRDLSDLMSSEDESSEWPVIEEKKKEWPGS